MPTQDLGGFFFAGAGTVPGFLAYAGDPGIAILAMIALFCAGCVGALADREAPFRTMSPEGDESGPRGD